MTFKPKVEFTNYLETQFSSEYIENIYLFACNYMSLKNLVEAVREF